jgi:hypothetical protein
MRKGVHAAPTPAAAKTARLFNAARRLIVAPVFELGGVAMPILLDLERHDGTAVASERQVGLLLRAS